MSMIEDDLNPFDQMSDEEDFQVGGRRRAPTSRVSDLPRGRAPGQHRPSYAPGVDRHGAKDLEPIGVRCGSCRSMPEPIDVGAKKKKKWSYGDRRGKPIDTTGMNEYELTDMMEEGSYMLIKADWCGHCKRAMPEYEKIAAKNPNKSFLIHDGDKDPEPLGKVGFRYDGFPTAYRIENDRLRRLESFGAFMEEIEGPRPTARPPPRPVPRPASAPHMIAAGARGWYDK